MLDQPDSTIDSVANLYCVSRGTIYRNVIRRTPKTGEKISAIKL
jgi:hypothetical protein